MCFFALVILGEGDGVVLWVVENATKSLVWVVVKGVVVWLLSDVVCLQANVVVLVKVHLRSGKQSALKISSSKSLA